MVGQTMVELIWLTSLTSTIHILVCGLAVTKFTQLGTVSGYVTL